MFITVRFLIIYALLDDPRFLAEKLVVKLALENLLCYPSLGFMGLITGWILPIVLEGDSVVNRAC
jgi:hypothetical protein